MSVSWTLTSERIADKAIEKCGRLGVGKSASPEDRALAMEALNGILKELPIYGFQWPVVEDSQTTISLVANVSPTALPTDYRGQLVAKVVGSEGYETELNLMTLAEWMQVKDKDLTADYPTDGYVDQSNQLWTWPVQNQAVSLNSVYQKVIDDTVAGSPPEIGNPFILGLAYGVAAEIGDEFGVSDNKINRFEGKWVVARSRGMMATMGKAKMTLEVDD